MEKIIYVPLTERLASPDNNYEQLRRISPLALGIEYNSKYWLHNSRNWKIESNLDKIIKAASAIGLETLDDRQMEGSWDIPRVEPTIITKKPEALLSGAHRDNENLPKLSPNTQVYGRLTGYSDLVPRDFRMQYNDEDVQVKDDKRHVPRIIAEAAHACARHGVAVDLATVTNPAQLHYAMSHYVGLDKPMILLNYQLLNSDGYLVQYPRAHIALDSNQMDVKDPLRMLEKLYRDIELMRRQSA